MNEVIPSFIFFQTCIRKFENMGQAPNPSFSRIPLQKGYHMLPQKDKIVISLTGHRPPKLAGYDMSSSYYDRLQIRLENIFQSVLTKYQQIECHSGMALGADTIWARAIIKMKTKYPNKISFIADIPDENQPSRWHKTSQKEWKQLIENADEIKQYAYNHEGKSYAYILNQRNIGMIAACDILLAVYNGDPTGGTANGVRDGVRMNKTIVKIDPNTI